jgi:glycosyltransferase involved in cell wall biosynthesis
MAPADRVVAVWTAGERALRSALGDAKVRLVDNGVRVEDFAAGGRAREVPRVLYVGLLTPRKGLLDLVEASRLLTARGVAHELCLVGGTPDEGPAAEAPVRAAAAGVARLLGSRPREEMAAVYADADVFCLPSWWEAMPLSVLEAMASGLPVVATDVGDVPRAVAHGETGYVVPPRCSEALADALEPLLRDERLRRRMGAAGQERVRAQFSSAATARSLSAVFGELPGRRT